MNENQKAIELLIHKISEMIQRNTSHLPYDQTFCSVIQGPAKNGRYPILKDGQIYEVQNSTTVNYQPGQTVWVKIPCGSLSDMHICGKR